jgi:hypothetical protein
VYSIVRGSQPTSIPCSRIVVELFTLSTQIETPPLEQKAFSPTRKQQYLTIFFTKINHQ